MNPQLRTNQVGHHLMFWLASRGVMMHRCHGNVSTVAKSVALAALITHPSFIERNEWKSYSGIYVYMLRDDLITMWDRLRVMIFCCCMMTKDHRSHVHSKFVKIFLCTRLFIHFFTGVSVDKNLLVYIPCLTFCVTLIPSTIRYNFFVTDLSIHMAMKLIQIIYWKMGESHIWTIDNFQEN